MYDYFCLKCGRSVKPDDVLYDLSPVLSIEREENSSDSQKIPIPCYVTADELRSLLLEPDKDGICEGTLTIEALMTFIAKRNPDTYHDLKELTYADVKQFLDLYNNKNEEGSLKNEKGSLIGGDTKQSTVDIEFQGAEADTADTADKQNRQNPEKEKEKSAVLETKACQALLKNRDDKDQASSDNFLPIIKDFYSTIYNAFDNNGHLLFRMKLYEKPLGKKKKLMYYGLIENNGDANDVPYKDVMICKHCALKKPNRLPANYIWEWEHIPVGFIGNESSGKTCLIVAITEKIKKDFDWQMLQDCDTDRREEDISRYQNNVIADKTEKDGKNVYNVTFLCGTDEKKTMLSFVDIAGEIISSYANDEGYQDLIRKFPLINSCKCYVLCLDFSSTRNISGIRSFINDRVGDSTKTVPPLLVTITKADSKDDYDAAYRFDRGETLKQIEDSLPKKYALINDQGNKKDAPLRDKLNKRDEFEKKMCDSWTADEKDALFYKFVKERNGYYSSFNHCSAYGGVPFSLKTKPQLHDKFTLLLNHDAGTLWVCQKADGRNTEVHDGEQYREVSKEENLFYHDSDKRFSTEFADGFKPITDEFLAFRDEFGSELTQVYLYRKGGGVLGAPKEQKTPNPKNIRLVTEWILRVCGIRPIWYERWNDDEELVYESYLLKKGEHLDYNTFKYPNTTLAHCAKALFVSIPKNDRYVIDHEKTRLTLWIKKCCSKRKRMP